jgi:uroporphyrinogen decarboxylase
MNSRERAFLALEHKVGDRIPIDFWASKGTIQNIEKCLGIPYDQFLDERDVDFRYIAGPKYIGPPLEDGKDIWGVKRTTVHLELKNGTENYQEVSESPLATAETVEDIENYPHWPSPDSFNYSGIEAQCDAIRAKNRVVVFMGDRLNRVAQLKPAMYLRGMENILIDMILWEDGAKAILGKVKDFYLAYLERILTAANGKIDIVLTGDDFGAQNGPLISPDMWRKFIKPGFAEYLTLIKKHNTKTMHHTCGSVVELIPDMIECGLDVLQSVQPEALNMSLAELMAKFGKSICFQGGISIQQTMPFGTPNEVRQEVKRIADLVKPVGGYIFCTAHNVQADTPTENVLALLDAYLEYGRV